MTHIDHRQRDASAFETCDEALESVKTQGFSWRRLRDYFPFTDEWMSEGQYAHMLETSLRALSASASQESLLALLDLQYSVFLEQVSVQQQMLAEAGEEQQSVAFAERVFAYLQINSNLRHQFGLPARSARTALLGIPPGTLANRLFGPQANAT